MGFLYLKIKDLWKSVLRGVAVSRVTGCGGVLLSFLTHGAAARKGWADRGTYGANKVILTRTQTGV